MHETTEKGEIKLIDNNRNRKSTGKSIGKGEQQLQRTRTEHLIKKRERERERERERTNKFECDHVTGEPINTNADASNACS
jgi:hypothetical protein